MATDEIKLEDVINTQSLFTEINKNSTEVNALVESMINRVNNGDLSTVKGMSFLELKYQLLLSYLINLTYVMLRKSSGEKIGGNSSVERLAEIRIVLEKIKPIEHKLKYQVEKLIRSSAIGEGSSGADPMKFKANPDALAADDGDSNDDNSDNDNEATNDNDKTNRGIYVPPKLAAHHYDGDETVNEKLRKVEERSRKRAVSSAILRELKEEYLDTPVEDNIGREKRLDIDLGSKRKIEYEEDYMTRLPVTKQEKHKNRKMTTVNTLGDEITTFSRPSGSKKRSLKGNKNSKRKFKKKHF